MKLTCPACNAGINPTEVNLKEGIAHCSTCHEYFKIADALRGSEVIRRIQKPEFSKIIVEKSPTTTKFWIPPAEWGFATFVLLCFAVGMILFTFLYVFKGLEGNTVSWLKLLAQAGFTLFMLLLFLRTAFESQTLTFGRNGLTLSRDLWSWKREKGGNTPDLQDIMEEVDNSSDNGPAYEIRLTFRNRKPIKFGRRLKPEERKWLLGELNALKDEYAIDRLKG